MKKLTGVKLALCLSIGMCTGPSAYAVNWFDVQTISLPEWGKGKVIGFLQPVYTNIAANPASNGQTGKFNLVAPTFDKSSQLFMQRARLFVRGSVNPNISYYVGTEMGENGYDYSFGRYAPRIIDANMVFSNLIPGVRFEVGNIRAPGPEGAMEGFMDFNFLDLFPTGIAQLMQPTFYTVNPSAPYKLAAPGTKDGYSIPGAHVSGNNGFRYPGVQVENWFMGTRHVEIAYGVMLADYGRLDDTATLNGPIVAGRLQASYLLDDAGGRFFRNDLTGFVWAQQAHPSMNGVSNGMTRDGFGMTYRNGYMQRGGTNVKAEYFEGSGNIAAPAVFNQFPGSTPAQYDQTVYAGSNNKAHGYAMSAGMFMNAHTEFVMRYDYYDRLPNLAPTERVFKNISTAAVYHITPMTKIVMDYVYRSISIPNASAIAVAQRPLAESTTQSIGNQIDIWAVYAF